MIYFGNPILYWIIKTIILCCMVLSGYLVTFKDPNKTKYWRFVLPSILLFGIFEGLRYMRGMDYPEYMQYFEEGTMISGEANSRSYIDPVFELFLNIFHLTGLPYWCGFTICSFFLIFSFSFLIKRLPHTAVWAFPLFFILCTTEAENLVRQYMSISFFCISLGYYLDTKLKHALIFTMFALGTHYSGFVLLLVFSSFCVLLARSRRIKKISAIPFIVIYLFLYFFFDPSYFSYFSELLQSISPSEESIGASYLNNADRWFTEEGSMSANRGVAAANLGFLYQFFLVISNILALWFGWKKCRDNRLNYPIFWFAYFSLLFAAIGGDIEIYMRFQYWFLFSLPILIGHAFFDLRKNTYYVILPIVLIRYGYYMFLGMWGAPGLTGSAFIWDI